MNSFNDWLHKIQGLTSRKIKPDLIKVKSILSELCKFSPKTKIIVVTGTNGKGTTIELITQMLLKQKTLELVTLFIILKILLHLLWE